MNSKKLLSKLKAYILSSRKLLVGLILLFIIVLLVCAAPFLTSYSPTHLSNDLLVPPLTNGHLLGTTNMGEDVWSQILYGGRVSLKIGIVAAILSGIIGVVFGGLSGYFGGIIDKIFTEITNIFLMIPSFFLILIVVAIFGSSMFHIMLIIALTSWPSNARMMRAQVMTLKERTFVKSARVLGENNFKILFHYIIPNGIYPIIANTTISHIQGGGRRRSGSYGD